MKISATIITLNEETNIEAALNSLAWADEIVVVDSGSRDHTVEIARSLGCKVYHNDWRGYAAQKNYAAEKGSNDWIFNLDADERVTGALASQITSLGSDGASLPDGFEMPRSTFYLGRWIKHSGWYPDYKLRLYNRKAGRWHGDYVHESVNVGGLVGRLTGQIEHYTVRSAADHHSRMDRYTSLAAEEMYSRGKRASVAALIGSPPASFLRSYILKGGFLDGIPGLAIAYFAAHYAFLKYIKLWEMDRREGGGRNR